MTDLLPANQPRLLSVSISLADSLASLLFAGFLGESVPVWDDFIGLAADELVLPSLHSSIQDSSVPANVQDVFAAAESLNQERNEAILRDVASVSSLLAAAGISSVVLKGAAGLLARVYPNLGARYLGDVDLLVAEEHLAKAVSLLSHQGFESDPEDRLGRFRHHHPPLQRAGSPPFELHRNVGMGISKTMLPSECLFERSVPIDFHGTTVRVPCPEHFITHLILHSQIRHAYHERIWPPLRAIHDLVLARRRFDSEMDWSNIERTFRTAGHSLTLQLHLMQVQQIAGMKLPYPARFGPMGELRWRRRQLLRRNPKLRYADPAFMFFTLLGRRFRLLQSAVSEPGGTRKVLSEIVRPDFYGRLVDDLLKGRSH